MSWNHKDKLLLTILREFGEKEVEPVIQNANHLLAHLPPKKRPTLYFFGNYNHSTHIFTWNKDLQQMEYDLIIKNYLPIFGDDSTLKKLFQDKVHLSSPYQNVIPYLLKIINASFHVVRIPFENLIHFALVKLSLKDTIDFDTFEHLLFGYRQYSILYRKKEKTKHHKLRKIRKIGKRRQTKSRR